VSDSTLRRIGEAARAATDGEAEYRRLVSRMGIAPLMGRVMEDPALVPSQSEKIFLRLRDRNLIDVASEMSSVFTRSGVDHFFFKGVALIGTVYRLGERDISDIDVFVRPQHRDAVDRLLAQMEFCAAPDHEQSGPEEMRSTLAYSRRSRTDPEEVLVDVHWSLDPLDRLLPRSREALPLSLWAGVFTSGHLRVPDPLDHIALVAHHLVRSDYLHLRGLIDLALLVGNLDEENARGVLGRCRALGCGRPCQVLFSTLCDDLGMNHTEVFGLPPATKLAESLSLPVWLRWWSGVDDDGHAEITAQRIVRRVRSLGFAALPGILSDAIWPPRMFLRWRWPGLTPGGRRRAHVRQIISKVVARPRVNRYLLTWYLIPILFPA
jgi:hypothetical protein